MTCIVFRADASTAIGSGHVARCATLACELTARGAEVRFLSHEMPEHYRDWLRQRGIGVTCLQGEAVNIADDIAQCRAALNGIAIVDWLVVDHYGLDARWETALRPLVKSIFVIDDKADRAHDCNLLLDQNFTTMGANRYSDLLPSDAKYLLGPRYALLRPEFATARAGALRTAHDKSVRRLLVCFGGSDPHRHTIATLNALRTFASRLERIDVVVGPANLDQTAIAAVCAELPSAVLHCPANNMAALLSDTDLAIGAGGSMNWERACLGVPTLAFGISDNQYPVMESLIEAGYVAGVPNMPSADEALIGAWIACLLDNPALLRGLSTRSGTLVDGFGTRRVADTLFPVILRFRPATHSDSDDLFRWRNDPEIRNASLSEQKIDRKTHERWLKKTLADPKRILLVAENEDKPAGVVRFDLRAPEAIISIYRAPEVDTPSGLIRQATNWLHKHHPEIRRIRAEVLPKNVSSLAAFRAAGYGEVSNTLVIELDAR